MAKKKTTPEKQFIAFDNYTETVIGRGTLKDVTELIEVYAGDEGYDEDGIIENVHVFELGAEMTVNAFARGIEVTIES